MPRQTISHLKMTPKQWQVHKRRQMKAVLDALHEFQFGLAYTPDHGEWFRARNELKSLAEKMRPRNWKSVR